MIRSERTVNGIVCSGLGEGARFTQLPWARAEFRARLGFEPHPGTFNLQLQGPEWNALRRRLAREAGIPITPANGYCAARCFRVLLDGRVEGAVVLPEVADYPADKLEVIAPRSLRQTLAARDGDQVALRLAIERTIEGVLFDIDGTVLRGRQAIPGAPGAIAALRQRGLRTAFLTNDNEQPVSHWVALLTAAGIPTGAAEIVTSSVIAAKVTRQLYPARKILAIGNVGLRQAMQAEQLHTVALQHAQQAEVVVIGKDPDFGQRTLEIVCRAIWNGAEFIATNEDPKVPAEDGFVPASGPMVRAIAYATDKAPLVTGKPSHWAAEMALQALGVPAARCAVVGDRLETDVGMANAAGMFSIAVLTGAATPASAAAAPEAFRPDLLLPDVSHLPQWLAGEGRWTS